MKELIFYLGLGTLFTHELDAMLNNEWSLFPLTSWMSDDIGMPVFVFLHIPLFAGIIALAASTKMKIRKRSRWWISLFLILHGLIHASLMISNLPEFNSLQSKIIIFLAAFCGLVYLGIEYFGQYKIAGK